MTNRRLLTFLAALPLVVAALTIVVTTATARGRSTLNEHIELGGGSETHDYDLNVPDGAASARLVVRARIKSGEIRMRLFDPERRQRLSGHGSRGHVELDTGTIEGPAPGVWRLRIELERAKGRYRVEWHSE